MSEEIPTPETSGAEPQEIPTPEISGAEPLEITSDDKLWVLLAYIFSPLVPVIILLLEDKRKRPFIRAHNAQALVVGVIEVIISFLLGITVVFACVPFILWVIMIYWGIQGYQGKYVTIPVVTSFCKNQGWA